MMKLPLGLWCGALIMIFVTLASSASAADRGVTSISVAGQAIGNSPQYATATISIFCPGATGSVSVYAVNNNQVLSSGSGPSGSFSVSYSDVPCGGTLTVRLYGQYEVRTDNDYQFGACVTGFQGECFGAATASVRVVRATYSLTSKKKGGTTTHTLVRTPAVGARIIAYKLGDSNCGTANTPLSPGGTTLQWTSTATSAVAHNCGPQSFGTWNGIDGPPRFPINQAWTPLLKLRGAIGSQTLGSPVALPGAVTAHVPLGAAVKFLITDEYGQQLSTSFGLSGAAPESGVMPEALFPNHVVFKYSAHGVNDITFQAVHRGQVTATVTVPTVAPAPFTIMVEDPKDLGSGAASEPHMQFSALAYPVAHRYGVPPQFLKAHAAQESTDKFNPLSYRYEPLGPEGDVVMISGMTADWRKTKSPYKEYNFATFADTVDNALPQGPGVNADDLRVAVGRLWVGCDPVTQRNGRPLSSTDTLVSVAELLHCNSVTIRPITLPDYRPNQFWVTQGPDAPARQEWAWGHDFAAQMSLAASYGYMQVLYTTAITLKWSGTPGLNPSSLFDLPQNVAAGGGSLTLGAKKVALDYVKGNSTAIATSPDDKFADPAAFLASFKKSWRYYNARTSYPADVAGKVPTYPIVPARSLF